MANVGGHRLSDGTDTEQIDPLADLQATIEKLLTNQRTPGTIEISRRSYRRILACLIIAVLFAAAGVVFAALNLAADHPNISAPAVHPVADIAPAGMTDQQLAAALTAVCSRHPGACLHTPTAANVAATFVPYVCSEMAQGATFAGNHLAPAWPDIESTIESTGRCSRLSPAQTAVALNWVPGGQTGVPVTTANLGRVLAAACPEIAAGTTPQTVRGRQALAVIAASGACSR